MNPDKHGPRALLNSVFGYDRFRDNQEDIIDHLIKGDDALVVMPTGAGKSLCYQLPSILGRGCGIIVSPLIALMQDQVTSLHQLGVRAAYLNSTLTSRDIMQIENQLIKGELDLLYIAPERLLQPRTLDLFDRVDLSLIAIDEAHCVSQWGHDFRSDYLGLGVLAERFPGVPRAAFTATADQRTREEIVDKLRLDRPREFISGFNRPNIQYRIALKNNEKQQLLQFLTTEHPGDSGIVYCLSRRKTEDIARYLVAEGFPALPYHAGLPAETRRSHQQEFQRSERSIMVATIAFGMGIDKPDVRFVAHLDLPKSVEAYYQETGRAGRDGDPATAWMVYGLQDVIKIRQMVDSSEAAEAQKKVERYKLDAMLGMCEITACRRQALLHYFGEDYPAPCSNCDSCLEPVETWDGTIAAQQAISCAYRTGQRFGVNHLIDVLLGKDTPKIRQHRHELISTFGIGTDLTNSQWRSVYRQLVALGLLSVDVGGYGSLQLSDSARPVLQGVQTLFLRRDPSSVVRRRQQRVSPEVSPVDQSLWDALKALRTDLAKQQGVPPYVIFSNATLTEMASRRPRSATQLLAINGIGVARLENYGALFIKLINQFEDGSIAQSEASQDYP